MKRAAERRLAEYLAAAVDPDRVLEEVACVAYFDPQDLYLPDGQLRPASEWPEGARRAIASIEVLRRNLTSGDGHTDEVLKVRVHDKVKALDQLMQHHNLLKRPAVTGEVTITWKYEPDREKP